MNHSSSGYNPTFKMLLKKAGVKDEKEFLKKFPTEESFFQAFPEMEMLKETVVYQDGGPMAAPQQSPENMQEQIIQFIVQSLQNGDSPEDILGLLVEQGIPEEQAGQIIQAVVQKIQEEQGAAEEMMPEMQPEMQMGGMYFGSPQEEGEENKPVMKKGGSYSGTYSAGVYYRSGGYLPNYSEMNMGGSFNNPGFNALPEYVQNKILKGTSKDSLKKYQFAGPTDDCGEGYTKDEFGNCVPDFNAQPAQQGSDTRQLRDNTNYAAIVPNFMKGLKERAYKESKGMPTNPWKTTGNEGTASNPMKQPFENAEESTSSITVKPKDCPEGYEKNKKGECVRKKKKLEQWMDTVNFGLTVGNAITQAVQNKKTQNEFESSQRNKLFTGQLRDPGREFRMGNVETQSGVQFPGSMTPPNEGMFSNAFYGQTPAQFGGFVQSMDGKDGKMKMGYLESMKYGGQFEGSYGLDVGWRNLYTDMAKTSSDYAGQSVSKKKNPKEPYVLEAEGGETLYKPGDEEFYNINGNRHTQGGVPLTEDQVSSKNSEEPSFIFSDTKKMRIKDKNILDYFGVSKKNGGVTPAAISKKYDLNKYKAILEDPNKDPLAKNTAMMMLERNKKRLSELAAIQEKMKGLDAPEFAQRELSEQPPMAMYGGYLPAYEDGGDPPRKEVTELPGGGKRTTTWGDFNQEYKALEDLLRSDKNKRLREELYNRFKKANPNSKVTQEGYIDNLLTAQKQNYAINNAYADNPSFLNDPSWDWGDAEVRDKKGKLIHGKGWKNKRYKDAVTELGMTPLKSEGVKQFQQAYRDLADAVQDPEFFESFGQYLMLDPKGLADQTYRGKPISGVDDYWGNTTRGQMLRMRAPEVEEEFISTTTTTAPPPPGKKPKWVCLPDGKGGGQVVQSDSGIGYDSPEEASKHCGEPGKRPPFDYLAPDKANMLATAAVFPEIIMPFNPEMAYSPRGLNLEDWRAKAAQRFSTQYAAPSAQLAQYTSPQGLAANLSMLAGQTAQQMAGEDIAPTISRNVDRVNQYTGDEAKRQDEINLFNLGQRQKRYEGSAVARQQYDNALREYLKQNADAYTRAWNNRMELGMINDTNKQFYVDPRTGRQTFYNPASFTGVTGESTGSDANLGSQFDSYYNDYYNQLKSPKLSEDEKSKRAADLAMAKIRSSREYETETGGKSSRKRSRFKFD